MDEKVELIPGAKCTERTDYGCHQCGLVGVDLDRTESRRNHQRSRSQDRTTSQDWGSPPYTPLLVPQVHLGKEDLDVRNCSEPVSLSQWSSLTQCEILYSPSSLSSKCWDILGHSRRTRKGSRSLVKDCKELCEEERLRKMFCRTSGPMEGKQKSFQLQTL